MKAAIYTAKGHAADVLCIEQLPSPQPQPGEVLVRIAFSGVNPSDVKMRAAAVPMDHAQVVPHSDGAGTVEAVGAGVDPSQVGRRVWLHNGQWGRAHGTAAELIALPAWQATELPEGVSLETGASIGIPLMTAFHAVDALGALLGRTVVVFGAVGAVGTYVTQLAARAGARVIAVVSSEEKAARAKTLGAHATVDYRREDVGERVRALTGGEGADALIDVDAAANAGHYAKVLRFGGQAVIYGSGAATVGVPFRPMIMSFVRLYFFIVYALPTAERRRTLDGIAALLAANALQHPEVSVFPLEDIVRAHEQVEAGSPTKVLVRP
jgi:NADPH:quinone reductase